MAEEGRQSYCERFHPDYVSGLSEQQVAQRMRQGLRNGSDPVRTKTVPQIIWGNLLTPFNILNAILAALVLAVGGSYKNLLFMGVIVCNILIGTLQEIRAKKTIDRLSLIAAPRAHVVRGGKEREVPVGDLVLDDVLVLAAGGQVPADCVILEGQCEADESLLTGEADAVFKDCGDSLLSGSYLSGGKCRARVEHIGAENYAQKITASAKYIKKPNSEILTWTNRIIKFIGFAIIPIGGLLFYKQIAMSDQPLQDAVVSTVAALIGMIPEGLVLLSSVVLAVGVLRLSRRRALVQELYSIETLARVDTLCLDKTGTITEGTMQADALVPLGNVEKQKAEEILAAMAAVLNDGTPTMNAVREAFPDAPAWKCDQVVPFSSARKWSAAHFSAAGGFILGAGEFILKDRFEEIRPLAEKYAGRGQRVLLLCSSERISADGVDPSEVTPLLLVLLSDRIRKNARRTLEFFSDQGVELKVISGDSPATVANIAKKAGLKNAGRYIDATRLKSDEDLRAAAEKYTVFGRVTPKQKLGLIKALKQKKHTVAMTGDGVNDVPALRESDCSIAMASGSDAARTVSQIVLLNSDFASMPEIVAEGRRCINNLQRSSTLFLVKAIFSAIIAVLFIFSDCNYPFQPIQFTLINAATIGIPSFFLGLEPNRERLHGRFIVNVLGKALPGALTMSLNIAVVSALSLFLGLPDPEISTLSVLVTGYTGLLVLFRVCWPFRAGHTVLFSLMCALFVLSLVFFPSLFEITPLTLPMLFVLVPTLFLATCLMPALQRIAEKAIRKAERRL